MKQRNIKERLKKIKNLTESGVDGEKENALLIYEELKSKYNFTDEEIVDEIIELEWFRYKDNLERKLATQICYMVTGSTEFWTKTDKKYKLIGCYCTDFEKKEIEFYLGYYKEHFKAELDIFVSAFCLTNHLYPDENTRCYKEPKDDLEKDKTELKKAAWMSMAMETHIRPRNLLEQ